MIPLTGLPQRFARLLPDCLKDFPGLLWLSKVKHNHPHPERGDAVADFPYIFLFLS
jgi:hypothetical protein